MDFDEAIKFAFVQWTEHQPSLIDKTHPEGQGGFGVGKDLNWRA
jgi:hypothetical protein